MIRVILLVVALAASTAAQTKTWTLPTFTVSKPTDAKFITAPAPGNTAAVYLEWTPSATPSNPEKPRLIFNHLLRHEGGGEVMLRTHYTGGYYGSTVLELSLGFNRAIRTGPVQIVRGRKHHLLGWWRPVGKDRTEVGLMMDGRILSVVLVDRLDRPNREVRWRVGSRGDRPVDDPTFPGVQHADGKIENTTIVVVN